MCARRVGFGGDEEAAPKRPQRGAEAAEHPADEAADAKELSGFGKFVLAGFLMLWLVGWSVGMWELSNVVPNSYARGDWLSLGFGLVWLTFAALGWLVAFVILIAVLFGRKPDPDKPSSFRTRIAERRAARKRAHELRMRDR